MKYMMGVSGLIWTGFVLVHMVGNFLLFAGADAYNSYSHFLTSGKMVYLIEGLLIFSLLSHVLMGVRLTLKNKASRPQRYAVEAECQKGASWASKTMVIHGPILLLFIVSHLRTFKFGTNYTTNVGGVEMRDIYKLVIEVFNQPLYVAGYLFCLILLGVHLSHGVSSVFQSFGFNHRAYEEKIKTLGLTYAVVVLLGFVSQPVYVFLFQNN
jgi:succinate dehydrogenase / fumarate reductase cytochrome b subunit